MPDRARVLTPLAAKTKYRVPRLRRSSIGRAALLNRLVEAVSDCSVVAVVAPAGYGKTTLLAQLAHAAVAPDRVAWFAIDADDNDYRGFFASLVGVLASLDLEWSVDPRELVANMSAAGAQSRAAAGELAAALESMRDGRIVVVLDDLHRVTSPDVAQLLESLIERLPDHVTLVLSSRLPLPLPMSRWVIGGEAAEFGPRDLEFSAQDASAISANSGGAPQDDQRIAMVLSRTHGWPAGAALMLRAPPAGDLVSIAADSHELLYDYLATEVLQRLPDDLQRFALDVSILAELTPELCGAVADCDDARAMLRSLYRQDLFVTAVDSTVPVLRLHDLFRDFLQSRLAAVPDRLRLLHERAARAEPVLSRAIGHYLAAGLWHPALQLMARHADALREQGHQQSMQRWLEQVPESIVANCDEGLQVRAYCAWLRWDWIQSRADMSRLLERMHDSGREPPAQALLSMMGFVSGVGERDAAARIGDEVSRLPLVLKDRAVLALHRAWNAMDVGDIQAVVEHFVSFVDAAAADPREIAPLIVDRTSPYIGLPGMLSQYQRFLAIGRTAMDSNYALWHGGYLVIEGWVALWRGGRGAAASAIEAAKVLQRRFGGVTPTEDALVRLEAVFLAATGEGADAVRLARTLVERFELPRYASIRVVFERAYWAGVGKVAWMSGDAATVGEVARRLLPPRRPQEWYFIDLARSTLQGQVAILGRRWREAEGHLASALELHSRLRFPQGHADPRVLAAYVQCMQGRKDQAWGYLRPALQECIEEDAVGLLICEPVEVVDVVLESIPPADRADPHVCELLQRLDAWRTTREPAAPLAGPLAGLSGRELEVLARVAQGEGNKDIARRLDLSLHTVKRHIANILGKLDCVSRRQAADLYRQHVR